MNKLEEVKSTELKKAVVDVSEFHPSHSQSLQILLPQEDASTSFIDNYNS